MFCPPRPAPTTSLPLPEMMRDMYYVDAASSASAYKSLLRLLDYSSYILHLSPLLQIVEIYDPWRVCLSSKIKIQQAHVP